MYNLKIAVAIILSVSMLALVGCGGFVHRAEKFNALSLGMSKQEVIEVMGAPHNTRASEGVEYVVYNLLVWGAGLDEYFIEIREGRVTSYGKVGDFGSTKLPEATINVNQTVKQVE